MQGRINQAEKKNGKSNSKREESEFYLENLFTETRIYEI